MPSVYIFYSKKKFFFKGERLLIRAEHFRWNSRSANTLASGTLPQRPDSNINQTCTFLHLSSLPLLQAHSFLSFKSAWQSKTDEVVKVVMPAVNIVYS